MDYKKEYEQAIERAKGIYNETIVPTPTAKGTCEYIFPELKESEDEKIRKELWEHFHNLQLSSDCDFSPSLTIDDILSWLEKQGEQKPINKILLGKKYKCSASPRYSTFMKGEIYKPEDEFLCSLMNLCSDCFEPIEDGEQKPAWSEEDERMLNSIVENLNNGEWFDIYQADWLKSLKDRAQPHTWKPSDEQMMALKCINLTGGISYIGQGQELINLYNDLKKLREE